MKKLLNIILLLCVCCFSLTAQKTITGQVTDGESQEPLIGASVFVNDSGIGTVTDFDGNFSLTVADDVSQINVSYIGYPDQVITLTDETNYQVIMTSGELLEEILVIGYGTIKREDATGSIQSVSSEDFNRGAITGPQELLTGKIAGVSITTGGDPGAGSRIRIRGESSLSSSNDPLIVIDGVPIESGNISGARNPLNLINPNDIETFTVLKDASATAIYGNRASGGVILITTKKSSLQDKFSVGYSGNISFGKNSNQVDVLNREEYLAALANHFEEDHPAFSNVGEADTDWQDEIYEQARGMEHNLTFAGSMGIIPYRLSLGHVDKDGVLKTDNFKRTSMGLNINPGFMENRLQVNLHFKGSSIKNNFADRGAIGNAVGFDPTQPVRSGEEAYGGFTTWTIANGNPNLIAPTNPVALIELRDDQSDVKRYLTNLSADYRFASLPDLRLNLNLAYDYSKGQGTVFVPDFASFAFDDVNGGGVNNEYEQTKENSLLEFYGNYKKQFNQHGVELMGGYSWQHFKEDNYFKNSDLAGTLSETTEGTDIGEYYLLSLFTRLNYDFNNKALLTLSLRRDGTSRFSPDNRWGLFPAAAVGYKLYESNTGFLNNVKLRAGWGVTGQQQLGGGIQNFYAYQSVYQASFDNALYQFGDQFFTTLRPNGYDENIKWEETTTINYGVDFSFLNQRVSGSFDIYQRDTDDLINRIPVPAGTNLTNFITTNVGSMENKGYELSLFLTPIQTENISWEFGFNYSNNKNTITKLTAVDDPDYLGVRTGGIAGGVGSNIQIHSVGFAPNSFFVYEQLYDADGNILEGQFADRNGDEMINEQDLYRYEKPAADHSFGFNTSIDVYGFNLSASARALSGNFVYNNVQTDQGYLDRLYSSAGSLWNVNQSAVDLNVNQQANLTFSDHFVKDASFFRIDHITLAYDLNRIAGYNSRIFATVQNPVLSTDYDGLDPETDNGIDNNLYPRPRTFVFGISAQF